MTTALVLAGTRPGGDPLALEMGVEHKALIEVDGTPMLTRVVSALQQAGIERVIVSCNAPAVRELALSLKAESIASKGGPSASALAAFELAGAPMVVTTSDHALLQPGWVRQLLTDTPAHADVAFMLAERRVVERDVPDTERTYWRFADGQWSGCNLFYLRTAEARRAIEMWSVVENQRKRPWRIAARLGPSTLLSLAVGRLGVDAGIARLGDRIGVKVSHVAASNGLAAVDVDKRADFDFVQQWLARRP